jgi:hypothetical protein
MANKIWSHNHLFFTSWIMCIEALRGILTAFELSLGVTVTKYKYIKYNTCMVIYVRESSIIQKVCQFITNIKHDGAIILKITKYRHQIREIKKIVCVSMINNGYRKRKIRLLRWATRVILNGNTFFLFKVFLPWFGSLITSRSLGFWKRSSFDIVKREVKYLYFIFQQEIYIELSIKILFLIGSVCIFSVS